MLCVKRIYANYGAKLQKIIVILHKSQIFCQKAQAKGANNANAACMP